MSPFSQERHTRNGSEVDYGGRDVTPEGLNVFDVLRTKDFERVMRTLRTSATVLDVFAPGHEAGAKSGAMPRS